MAQTLERAIAIAATAHTGQVDKGGAPYILHPLKVMLRMNTLEERIVAVLHDVVEDCGVSLDDLRGEGFSEEVLAAIAAVLLNLFFNGMGSQEEAKARARDSSHGSE